MDRKTGAVHCTAGYIRAGIMAGRQFKQRPGTAAGRAPPPLQRRRWKAPRRGAVGTGGASPYRKMVPSIGLGGTYARI